MLEPILANLEGGRYVRPILTTALGELVYKAGGGGDGDGGGGGGATAAKRKSSTTVGRGKGKVAL